MTVLGVPQLDLATPAHFGRAQAAERPHGASGELLPEGAASKTRTLDSGASTPTQPWMIPAPRRKVPFGQDLGRILAFAAARAARPGAGAAVVLLEGYFFYFYTINYITTFGGLALLLHHFSFVRASPGSPLSKTDLLTSRR